MIPFSRPVSTGKESRAAKKALSRQGYAGQGPHTLQAELRLSKIYDGTPVILTNSGSTALLVALLGFQLGPRDKIIVPSFGFVAVAQAVTLAGATPVFVDVDIRTGSMSPESLVGCVVSGVRGIIVIHYGGFAADMDRIQDIASSRGWFVVEDAAHGFAGRHARGRLGTLGDVGVLSFDHQKNVQCGEGGAIIVNSTSHLEPLKSIATLGTTVPQLRENTATQYDWVSSGVKGYPPDYVAAILMAQLDETTQIQRYREMQVKAYFGRLQPWAQKNSVLVPMIEPFATRPSWHIFWLTFIDSDSADSFISWMKRAGVDCRKHYSSLALLTKGRVYEAAPTNASDQLAACLVRLPLGLHLSERDLDLVIDSALDWPG